MYDKIIVNPQNMLEAFDIIKSTVGHFTQMRTRNAYTANLEKAVFLIKKYHKHDKSIIYGNKIRLSKESIKDIDLGSFQIRRTVSSTSGHAIMIGSSSGNVYASLIYSTDTVYITTSGIYIFKNGSCILSRRIPHFEVWRYAE